MNKSLIISIVWLCGTYLAFGQCGSARDTDLDGSFVSSTSSDPCGGHGKLIAQDQASALGQCARYQTVSRENLASCQRIFVTYKDRRKLVLSLPLIDRLDQTEVPSGIHLRSSALKHVSELQCNPLSGATTAARYPREGRRVMLRAAREEGWQ